MAMVATLVATDSEIYCNPCVKKAFPVQDAVIDRCLTNLAVGSLDESVISAVDTMHEIKLSVISVVCCPKL